jgi:hypothetical protein
MVTLSIFTLAVVALGLSTAEAGPSHCYKGCTDNGGIPTGDYLDNACESVECAATDTHCLSVFSTATTHSNSINPVTGAMDTDRLATTERKYALGCVDAAKKADLIAEYDAIFPDGLDSTDECATANCNKCQITDALPITTYNSGAATPNLWSGDDDEPGATAGVTGQCRYGSFGNDWKYCNDVYCMIDGAVCLSIKFAHGHNWAAEDGVWTSGVGCQADATAAAATCSDWEEHKDFLECEATCDPTTTNACNTCIRGAAAQTAPSAIAACFLMVAGGIASYAASF